MLILSLLLVWLGHGSFLNLKQYFPTEYDLTLLPQYQGCDFQIQEDGVCAAGWRYAVTQTLQNLFCIKTGLKQKLSAQQLLSCSQHLDEMACQKFDDLEYLTDALDYIRDSGISTESCYPDNSNLQTTIQGCASQCVNGSDISEIYTLDYTKLDDLDRTSEVKQYILDNGPVIMVYKNSQDLVSYMGMNRETDFHQDQIDDVIELGYVAMKVVGWTTDEERQYWIAANSWGSIWGNNGYINIPLDDDRIESFYGFS